jgi:hypothetical protein
MCLHCHLASEYTGTATAAGLRLRSLAEPPLTESAVITPAADIVPDANRAAFTGLPAVSIWDFELAKVAPGGASAWLGEGSRPGWLPRCSRRRWAVSSGLTGSRFPHSGTLPLRSPAEQAHRVCTTLR